MIKSGIKGLLSLSLSVFKLLATGGLAALNPMTLVSLMGGVLKSLDGIKHPSCDDREKYLQYIIDMKHGLIPEDAPVPEHEKSWAEWIVNNLSKCDAKDEEEEGTSV